MNPDEAARLSWTARPVVRHNDGRIGVLDWRRSPDAGEYPNHRAKPGANDRIAFLADTITIQAEHARVEWSPFEYVTLADVTSLAPDEWRSRSDGWLRRHRDEARSRATIDAILEAIPDDGATTPSAIAESFYLDAKVCADVPCVYVPRDVFKPSLVTSKLAKLEATGEVEKAQAGDLPPWATPHRTTSRTYVYTRRDGIAAIRRRRVQQEEREATIRAHCDAAERALDLPEGTVRVYVSSGVVQIPIDLFLDLAALRERVPEGAAK